jgi:hypothetical protein
MQVAIQIAHHPLLPLSKQQCRTENNRNATAVSQEDLAVSVIIAI